MRMMLCVVFTLGVPLAAQDTGSQFAEAKKHLQAKEWERAVDLLLPLADTATTDRQREAAAMCLTEAGDGLRTGGRLPTALRGYEAALRLLKELHGDEDHPNVAASFTRVAYCHESLGQSGKALPHFEAALAMWRRLHGEQDHPDVASSLNNLAQCLESLGQSARALPQLEAALAMRRRLYGEQDHPAVARSFNNLGQCLQSLSQSAKALPHFEAALAMWRRRHGERDHPDVATGLGNLAGCLHSLGQAAQALPHFEAALAVYRRLYGEQDHPDVATGLNNVAYCLESLGRAAPALPHFEAALAMWQRLQGGQDHPRVAASLNNVAYCLESLGQLANALPHFEAALAMLRRLYGEQDHPYVARSLNNVAHCLQSLGQSAQALPQYEATLAMYRRLFGEQDHREVATSLHNVAYCLESLGQAAQALPQCEAALAMYRRLYGEQDHPDVARGLNNVAHCLQSLGQSAKALPQQELALAMRRRLHGERDHPDVATSLNNVALCLHALGQPAQALRQHEAALAMRRRLYGEQDHAEVAMSLNNLASCLGSLGQPAAALPHARAVVAMVERLFEQSRTLSNEVRQGYFDELKEGSPFERLQRLCVTLGNPAEAFSAAERGRGRVLLELLAQQCFDPLAESLRLASLRGDERMAARLPTLQQELDAVRFELDRLLHERTRLGDDPKLTADARTERQKEILVRSNTATLRRRQLLDERAAAIADVLPAGRVKAMAEVQAALQPGELLLQFSVAEGASFLYVLARGGEVEATPLPKALAAVREHLPVVLRHVSHGVITGTRGEALAGSRPDTGGANRAVFAALIPPAVWERVAKSRRVWLAPHRSLHQLPFELLEVGTENGQPVLWLDRGPPIAYVHSGSALCWLRQRAKEARDDRTRLDFLAVGDPNPPDVEPQVPEQGAYVVKVNEGGEGARAGLRAGDVLVRYGGEEIADDRTLRDLIARVLGEVEDGKRPRDDVALAVWRRGVFEDLRVKPGRLGIEVGRGHARFASEAALTGAASQPVLRAGDLDRLRALPALRGARTEAEAIASVFAGKHGKVQALFGADATETAVTALAPQAKFLHFACHGVAEEYHGRSLSMLVLSQTQRPSVEDDGLLQLDDLLQRWRGNLGSCRLVVLSACKTLVGPTHRDEAPTALPLGFLFAGASSVIASLWPVDDASTRELMTDFYSRLQAGETDRLQAFTAAKQALRKKHSDPFHWAPFLYMGSPE